MLGNTLYLLAGIGRINLFSDYFLCIYHHTVHSYNGCVNTLFQVVQLNAVMAVGSEGADAVDGFTGKGFEGDGGVAVLVAAELYEIHFSGSGGRGFQFNRDGVAESDIAVGIGGFDAVVSDVAASQFSGIVLHFQLVNSGERQVDGLDRSELVVIESALNLETGITIGTEAQFHAVAVYRHVQAADGSGIIGSESSGGDDQAEEGGNGFHFRRI